jgi:hypothetical protein
MEEKTSAKVQVLDPIDMSIKLLDSHHSYIEPLEVFGELFIYYGTYKKSCFCGHTHRRCST